MMTTSTLRLGAGMIEGVAVANFVADFEVFAVDVRCGMSAPVTSDGCGDERVVDRATGGDGACDDKFDEIAARIVDSVVMRVAPVVALRLLEKILRFGAEAARANAIPDRR